MTCVSKAFFNALCNSSISNSSTSGSSTSAFGTSGGTTNLTFFSSCELGTWTRAPSFVRRSASCTCFRVATVADAFSVPLQTTAATSSRGICHLFTLCSLPHLGSLAPALFRARSTCHPPSFILALSASLSPTMRQQALHPLTATFLCTNSSSTSFRTNTCSATTVDFERLRQ